MPTSPTKRRAAGAVLFLAALLMALAQALALDLPSRREVRARVLKKLEEIREKTPTARARAKWLKLLEDANATLKEAVIEGAPRYSTQDWNHARWLCELSLKYGRKREYRKAEYLARLCRESGQKAMESAKEARGQRVRRYREQLDTLYALLRRAERRQSIARIEADEIRLRIRDLENALALEQFDDVQKGIEEIAPRLRELASRKEIWGL